MIAVLKALLRLTLSVVWLAFGFSFGFYAGGKACELWILPAWARHYPHHGHLDLAVVGSALGGGLLGAAVAAVIGYYLLAMFTLPPPDSEEGRLRAVLDSLDVEIPENFDIELLDEKNNPHIPG